jgi:hypothetical protein
MLVEAGMQLQVQLIDACFRAGARMVDGLAASNRTADTRPQDSRLNASRPDGARPEVVQPEPDPEGVRVRAHELYERRGREPGHELDDWATAEAEVRANAAGTRNLRD